MTRRRTSDQRTPDRLRTDEPTTDQPPAYRPLSSPGTTSSPPLRLVVGAGALAAAAAAFAAAAPAAPFDAVTSAVNCGPIPSFSLIFFSISLATSGFSRR